MVIRGTDSIHSDFQNGSVKYEPFGMLILWANWNEVLEQIKESSWKWANLGHQEDLSLHSIWCPWAKFRSLVSTLLDLALICLHFPGKLDQYDFLGNAKFIMVFIILNYLTNKCFFPKFIKTRSLMMINSLKLYIITYKHWFMD